MKKLTTRLLIATATLVVAAGAASAQTMTGAIPFEFRAVNRVMAPGTYQVDLSYQTGAPIIRLLNVHSGRSITLLRQAAVDPATSWLASGEGKLVFACSRGRCALAEVYTGSGNSHAYTVYRLKLVEDETAVLTEITLRPGKGE
jgi:hypothetical protein